MPGKGPAEIGNFFWSKSSHRLLDQVVEQLLDKSIPGFLATYKITRKVLDPIKLYPLSHRRLIASRRVNSSVPFGIEISPLYALDASELKSKLTPGLVVEGPLYLH